jgi:hypothetical protein
MATSFGLTREYTTTSSVLVSEFFNDSLQHQQVLIDKIFEMIAKEYEDSEEMIVTATATGIHKRFLELHKQFQKQCKVRIAIIGGPHRTALAIHVLGNYYIGNHVPKKKIKGLFFMLKKIIISLPARPTQH